MRSPPKPLPAMPPETRSSKTVEQQLARLYGESLFGPWLDPLDAMAAGGSQRKRGRWGKRLGILLLAALIATAGAWLTRRGLTRRAEQERAQVAKDVATFLADGELDRLAQFLAILLPPGQRLEASDPFLDLIVSAEAALYRYQDAAPARLARIAPYLSLDPSQPARFLARLTVASRPERPEARGGLESLLPDFAKDPEYRTLMASVYEQRGDVKAARESWERSAHAGPLWLPHRYLQCAFEARQHDAPAVARVAGHMAKVAPQSPWTRLALQHFSHTSPLPSGGTSVPLPPSPVAQYHAELALALGSLAAHDLGSARQALGRALAAVHDQPSFVLDAFAALLAGKAEDLAMEMTSFEAWPRRNPWAKTKLAELEATLATRMHGPAPRTEPQEAAVEPAKAKPRKAGVGKKKAGKKKAGKARKHRSRRRR